MARAGLDKHRKFLRLARSLDAVLAGMGELLARGALETLWSAAYERADDYLGDQDDVEIAARWRGQRGFLFEALLNAGGAGEAGFIELVPERAGYFRIHDLWEHAPPWVKRKEAAAAARTASGRTIADARREAAQKRWSRQETMQPVDEPEATGMQKVGPLHGGNMQPISPGRGTGEGEGKGRDQRTDLPADPGVPGPAALAEVPPPAPAGAGGANEGGKKPKTPKASKPPKEQPKLAFRAARALELVAQAAGPEHFVNVVPCSRGYAIGIERHIPHFSEEQHWTNLGEYLASGRTHFDEPPGPSVLAGDYGAELLTKAQAWAASGKPAKGQRPRNWPPAGGARAADREDPYGHLPPADRELAIRREREAREGRRPVPVLPPSGPGGPVRSGGDLNALVNTVADRKGLSS